MRSVYAADALSSFGEANIAAVAALERCGQPRTRAARLVVDRASR